MMTTEKKISQALSYLNANLVREITNNSLVKEIPKGAEILREGQYVKVIPIVLEGLIKVFTTHEDKELLLYYIKPNESCIMSFAASLKNEPGKVFAIAEEDTSVLLMPADKVNKWTKQFPEINALFFQQYNLRYSDLLDTIHKVFFDKMDKRIYEYIKQKVELTNKNPLRISHKQIANELGSAREVVSRVIKKLENEGKLIQHSNSIEIVEK